MHVPLRRRDAYRVLSPRQFARNACALRPGTAVACAKNNKNKKPSPLKHPVKSFTVQGYATVPGPSSNLNQGSTSLYCPTHASNDSTGIFRSRTFIPKIFVFQDTCETNNNLNTPSKESE